MKNKMKKLWENNLKGSIWSYFGSLFHGRAGKKNCRIVIDKHQNRQNILTKWRENVCKVLFDWNVDGFWQFRQLMIKRQVQNPYDFLLEDPKTPIPVCWSTLDILKGNDLMIKLLTYSMSTYLRQMYFYVYCTYTSIKDPGRLFQVFH